MAADAGGGARGADRPDTRAPPPDTHRLREDRRGASPPVAPSRQSTGRTPRTHPRTPGVRGPQRRRTTRPRANRWGIVGLGRIADAAPAPAIRKDPSSELVAVVSRDPDRARAFTDRRGYRWAGTDYEAMLALPDVVLTAPPNALHANQVVAAARAGKQVFCEKPLATTAPAARRAADACREAGVT